MYEFQTHAWKLSNQNTI